MKITAKLDLKDKILHIYDNDDLLEVCLLDTLEDYWQLVEINGEKYDFNLYKDSKKQILTMYETYFNEKDEIVTNLHEPKNIELTIED